MKESKFFEEVMAEGGLIATRKAVLAVLDVRFGSEAVAPFKAPLEAITRLDRLEQLHRLATQCRQLPEFRKELTAAVSEE